MSQCYYKAGDLEARAGRPAPALENYQKGLAAAGSLYAANPNSADGVRLVSAGYNRIGDVQLRRGDAAEALATYRKGADTIRNSQAAATESGARSLSVANFRAGDALYYKGGPHGGPRHL